MFQIGLFLKKYPNHRQRKFLWSREEEDMLESIIERGGGQ